MEGDDRNLCPCCYAHSFDEAGAYEICPICGWEDDPVQRMYKDLCGGANKMSLLQAREAFRNGGREDE